MADRIQFRRDSSTNWTNTNPILAQGEIGLELDSLRIKMGDGVTEWNDLPYGLNGQEVELRVDSGYIQWKYEDEEEWTNLVALEDLKGDEIELQVTGTHIQWKYIGEEDWINLIELSELKGDKGDDGDDGREIELQTSLTHIQWKYTDEDEYEWVDLVALEDLKGTDGVGVPEGGTEGQVLTKNSADDYDTSWQDPTGEAGVPDGGVENDILVKQSAVDGDVDWVPSGTAAFEDMSRDGGIVLTVLEADRLVTVGDGGDYATLQEAFDGEAHWISAGYEIEVRMLSGFEISTGVQLDAGNFRHFRLTGEDAVHDVIDGFTGHVIVFNDVIGFTLGVLIDMKGEGGDGIRAVNANFVVNEDCGVINAGDFGIRATTSNFRAVDSNFHGATNRGVNCVQLCNGNVNNADLEGAGDHGLRVQAMSIVSANNTMCRRGEVDTDNDVFITDGGIIQFGLGGRTGGTNVPVNELTSAGFILQ